MSTSRADYGCLKQLMFEVHHDEKLELQVVMLGRHWLLGAGTHRSQLTEDGLSIALVVDAEPRDDNPTGIGEALGRAVQQFSAAIPRLAPHVMVVLGDRFEMMAPALSAVVHNVPIAHVHGGELSFGAIDDSIRHALTKLARLHFVATPEYAARVRQMGECADSVFCVGAPTLDGLKTQPRMTREQLARELGMSFEQPVALVTFHPVTREPGSANEQIGAVLTALERSGLTAVLTTANADASGRQINEVLEKFAERNAARYRLFSHLGQRLYFACLTHCATMIGNSSSGLIEAPSYGLPVVNIGKRQEGRVRAANVIDVDCEPEQILAAIRQALEPEFRMRIRGISNPYDPVGDGRTSWRIKEILKSALAAGLTARKRFEDAS